MAGLVMLGGSARNAGFLFLTQIASALANLPISVLLARSMGPTDYGNYQLIYRAALIAVSIGCYGYPHALAWASARSSDSKEDSAVWRASIRTGLIGGLLLGGTALASVLIFHFHPGGERAWLVVAAFPLFNLLSANLVNFWRGKLRVQAIAVIRLSQTATWVLLITLITALGRVTVTSAVLTMTLSQAVGVVAGLAGRRKKAPILRGLLQPTPKYITDYARRAFLGIAVRDLNVYVDQIVIALLLRPSDLGVYAVAVSLTASIGLLSAPITNTVQPILQRATVNHRRKVATTTLVATLLVLGFPALVLAAFAPLYVPTLYGSSYERSVLLIQLLSVAAVVDGLNSCCHGILLGLGQPARSSVSASIGLVGTVVMLAVLLPTFGVVGAAWASIGAYLTVLVFMVRSVARSLDVPTFRLMLETLKSTPMALKQVKQLRPHRTANARVQERAE